MAARHDPLVVTARLEAGAVLTRPPMLDSLLEWVVHNRAGRRLPPARGESCTPLDVPLALSDCGRYRLCSAAQYRAELHEVRHKHRRAPWIEYARLGSDKIRRVDTSAGANKSYRVPFVVVHPESDTLVWYAVGDLEDVRDLVSEVHYLGRHRSSGKGRVLGWEVAPSAVWPGFPVEHDGHPLRPLPDADGFGRRGFAVLMPPYWDTTREEPCRLPAHW